MLPWVWPQKSWHVVVWCWLCSIIFMIAVSKSALLELTYTRFLDVDIVGCRKWTWIHYLAEFNFILLGDQMLGEIGCHPEICFYIVLLKYNPDYNKLRQLTKCERSWSRSRLAFIWWFLAATCYVHFETENVDNVPQ